MVTCWLGNYDKQVNKIDMHSLNQNQSLFADPDYHLYTYLNIFLFFKFSVFIWIKYVNKELYYIVNILNSF